MKRTQNLMKTNTYIHSSSSYLPKEKLSNHDLEKRLDTSNEWIIKRTGISTRHILTKDESVISMVNACAKSLVEAAIDSNLKITSVIVATSTTMGLPSVACHLCNHFSIEKAFALDINAACSGFMYALNLANDRLKNHDEEAILVIGADAMSQIIDWQDRTTAVLFGDGAGGVLLKKHTQRGLKAIQCASDNLGADMLNTITDRGQCKLIMQGKEVFKHAVEKLYGSALSLANDSKIDLSTIDWVVPHQANRRILETVIKKLKIPEQKLICTLDRHANTSAASIPLALDNAIRNKTIQRGQRLLLQAFGAGFTWGSAICDY